MGRSEGFLGRWSRLKDEARRADPEPTPAAEPAPEASPDAPGELAGREAGHPATGRQGPEPVDLESLPSIDSLSYDSDYTVFLREGVPPELRKEALRRLWRSDPVLANLDGLLEYGEDYSGVGKTRSIVKTAYRVGRGMLHEDVSERERPPADVETDQPPAPAEGQEVAGAEPAADDEAQDQTDPDGKPRAGTA